MKKVEEKIFFANGHHSRFQKLKKIGTKNQIKKNSLNANTMNTLFAS